MTEARMRRSRQLAGGMNGAAARLIAPGLAGAAPAPAFAQTEAVLSLHSEALSAGGLSMIVVGLIVFATTTSILYVRERARWNRRESELAAGLEAARSHQERLSALLAADRQV